MSCIVVACLLNKFEPQATLNRYRFRNTMDGWLKFSLTDKLHEYLQMLVDNLNLREKGWAIG